MKLLFLFLCIVQGIFSAYYCPHSRIEVDEYCFKSAGKNSEHIYPYEEIEKDIKRGKIIKNTIDDRKYWDEYKNAAEYKYIDTGENIVLDKNNSKKIITNDIYECICVAFSIGNEKRGLFHIYNDIKNPEEFDTQLRNLKEVLSKLTIEQKRSLNIAIATSYFTENLTKVVNVLNEISKFKIDNSEYENLFEIYYSNIFPIYWEAKNWGREKSPHWKLYFKNNVKLLWNFYGPRKSCSAPVERIRMIYKGEWWGPRHMMIDENGKIFINKYSYSDGFVDWDIFDKKNDKNSAQKKKKKFLKTAWLFTATFFFVSILLRLLNNSSKNVILSTENKSN